MKTSEMIAMLEKNPKLILESEKVNLVDDDLIVKMSGDNVVFFYDKEGKSVSKAIGLDLRRNWQLVRTPVPWQEAIQAVLDGKTVTCECEECTCTNKNPSNCIYDLDGDICAKGIEFGTWYIHDADA